MSNMLWVNCGVKVTHTHVAMTGEIMRKLWASRSLIHVVRNNILYRAPVSKQSEKFLYYFKLLYIFLFIAYYFLLFMFRHTK